MFHQMEERYRQCAAELQIAINRIAELEKCNATLIRDINAIDGCWEKKMEKAQKEINELKLLLHGSNQICDKIAKLVGDRGQYRDLVEAVEQSLTNAWVGGGR